MCKPNKPKCNLKKDVRAKGSNLFNSDRFLIHTKKNLIRYDPRADRWMEEGPKLNTKRDGHALITVDDRLLAIGGTE